MAKIWLPKFDPATMHFIARSRMKVAGKAYRAGDLIKRGAIPDHKLRRLYENRKIVETKDPAIAGEPTEIDKTPTEPVYEIEASGGWKYITKDGERTGNAMRAAEADAELARLKGAVPLL